MLVRYVFNDVIPQERYGMLVFIALLTLVIQGAYFGVGQWVRQMVFTISKDVSNKLRKEAVTKLFSLSEQAYSHLNRAGLHAKFIIDIERVDRMSEALIGRLLPSLIVGLLLIFGMVFVSWQLFVVALVVFASLVPVTRWTGSYFRQLAKKYQSIVRAYSARLEFSISQLTLIKLKSAEDQELAIHEAMIQDVTQGGRKLAIWKGLFAELHNFFAFATAVVLLGVGVGAASAGMLTLGEVLAFYVLAMLFRGQYTIFSSGLTPVYEGVQALSTIKEVLTFKENLPYLGTNRIKFQGAIRLEDVKFGYGEGLIFCSKQGNTSLQG